MSLQGDFSGYVLGHPKAHLKSNPFQTTESVPKEKIFLII